MAALKNYQRYASDGVVVCCRCAPTHGVNIELFSCDCEYELSQKCNAREKEIKARVSKLLAPKWLAVLAVACVAGLTGCFVCCSCCHTRHGACRDLQATQPSHFSMPAPAPLSPLSSLSSTTRTVSFVHQTFEVGGGAKFLGRMAGRRMPRLDAKFHISTSPFWTLLMTTATSPWQPGFIWLPSRNATTLVRACAPARSRRPVHWGSPSATSIHLPATSRPATFVRSSDMLRSALVR